MRRPDDSGHKRARTESNESTEILDEGTSLPSAKRKHTEHNQLDPSNNELARGDNFCPYSFCNVTFFNAFLGFFGELWYIKF